MVDVASSVPWCGRAGGAAFVGFTYSGPRENASLRGSRYAGDIMKLHTYFRSSASYRVRIALQLKGLPYDSVPVHLVRGEQKAAAYASHVGDALVPTLVTDEGLWLTQSMAIIEYLDETHAQTPLLPADALGRAHVRALAQMVACEIHPLNNLRVLKYLVHQMGSATKPRMAGMRTGYAPASKPSSVSWRCWMPNARPRGWCPRLCWGDTPTLAECCLVPQIYNAQRFNVNLDALPRLMGVVERCNALPAFKQAHPSACPDAE